MRELDLVKLITFLLPVVTDFCAVVLAGHMGTRGTITFPPLPACRCAALPHPTPSSTQRGNATTFLSDMNKKAFSGFYRFCDTRMGEVQEGRFSLPKA